MKFCLAAHLKIFIPADFENLIFCFSFFCNKDMSSTYVPTFHESVYAANMVKPGDSISSSDAQILV